MVNTNCCLRAALSALFIAMPAIAVSAPSADELDERLTVLERRMDNASLAEIANEMQGLRREVQHLRGDLDMLKREMEEIRQRQRDLYIDVDGRLQDLEAAQDAPPPTQGQTPTDSMAGNGGGAAGDNGQDAGSVDGDSAPASGGNTTTETPDAAYRSAFETLKAGRYEQAAQAFQAFLEQHGNSSYADNARYWLGESYYVVRSFDAALEHFQQLLDDFPDSPKRPDALLKIGFIHYENGDLEQSRQTLERVREQHPDSTAASLAQERLERIEKES